MKRNLLFCAVNVCLILGLVPGCITIQDRWAAATSEDTIQSYEDFLQRYPESEYSEQAKSRLETLQLESDWQMAQKSNTIGAYEIFLRKYPNSRYSNQAKSALQQLRDQLSIWQLVQQQNSLEAYNNFLRQHPDSPYAVKARQEIAEWENDIGGREVVEALESKRIEVEVTGSGIRDVSMKIRRLVDHPVKVTIPVGTYFACGGSSQNMIGRQERTITLNSSTWYTVSVPAACANRSRPIPGQSDSFTVRQSPNQAELERLMTVLDKANVPFDVEQAAIWIVTDNADYSDLGVLVSRPSFQAFGGTRVINEDEAARAMKLCEEAGIKINRKRIWADRHSVLERLRDEDLKVWLQEKGVIER
jgi:hypothetical protein